MGGFDNHFERTGPLNPGDEPNSTEPLQVIAVSTTLDPIVFLFAAILKYGGEPGETHVLGLLAEQATETLRRNQEHFTDAGLAVTDTPYLGNVTTDTGGIVQRIEIRNLLSESVRNQLFCERIGSE